MLFEILLFIGAIFLIMGLIFFAIASICNARYNQLYKRCNTSTIGTFHNITEKHTNNNMNNTTSFYPVYEYIVNNQKFYCKGNNGTYSKKNVTTEDVTVYYNPNHPSESYFDKDNTYSILKILKVLSIIFIIVAVICMLTGLIISFKTSNNKSIDAIEKYEVQTSEYFSNEPSTTKYYINSKEELESFYELYSNKINIDEKELANSAIFIQVKSVGSGSIDMQLKKVKINNKVEFVINTSTPEFGTDDMAFWYFIAIIPNEKIQGVDISDWIKPSEIIKERVNEK